MSEYDDPQLIDPAHKLTVDDVRSMTGQTTPHFSLHIRNRLRRLIKDLPADDPARQLAEVEITRLEKLAVEGQQGHVRAALPRIDGQN